MRRFGLAFPHLLKAEVKLPDKDGKLSKEEAATVQDWIIERWKGPSTCLVCESNQWTMGEHMVAPIKMTDGGGIVVGGSSYPQVMLVCSNCGYTLYFNAPLIGITTKSGNREGGGSDGT